MSKHARMKEKERRRQEFARAHAFKNSPAYLKGPKKKGSTSPLYEIHTVEVADSGVVAERPKPRDFRTYDERYGYSTQEEPVRSFASPPSPLESRVSSVDVSSLPPLPADGGLELLFVDPGRGEFVLIGGRNIGLSMDHIIGASPSAYVIQDLTALLNRWYTHGGGFYGNTFVSDLLDIPAHRVRSYHQFQADLSLGNFKSFALPSEFQRAEQYVAKALKEAAEHDARAQLSGQRSLLSSPSPASGYVPFDPDPSGVYCVLHNRYGNWLYVFLDPRTLSDVSSGTAVASKRFFEERIQSDQFPPELEGVLSPNRYLPFEFVDPYMVEGIGAGATRSIDTLRTRIAEVFGAPQSRILSFSYDGELDNFVDLAEERNYYHLRDLVIKYTDLARQTGKTIFE